MNKIILNIYENFDKIRFGDLFYVFNNFKIGSHTLIKAFTLMNKQIIPLDDATEQIKRYHNITDDNQLELVGFFRESDLLEKGFSEDLIIKHG